uniref:Uncharacterized protein n=1 Tax=Chlorobium phaeovibrioides (strain DSM 265 / 1930) TaxID=290318 RepID=A4SD91_CHLPM
MAADTRINALSQLLDLERMARRAEDPQALRYVMVNETGSLVPCRQAAFWEAASGRVVALSGVSLPERNAPFVEWLERLMVELHRVAAEESVKDEMSPKAITAEDMPDDVARSWASWLPAHLLSIPIVAPGGELTGILVLARATPFAAHEPSLAAFLSEAYGHALHALRPKNRPTLSIASAKEFLRKDWKRTRWIAGGLLFVALFPVRMSALAPAEVSARNPWVVRAPIDGVVRSVDVSPNGDVKKGQRIVSMDRTTLENALAVTRQGRMVAEAEYRRAAQQAVFSRDNMSEMSILRVKVSRLRAEEEYAAAQLSRTVIAAEKSGIAVYGNQDDWNGRPVRTGERILSITDPGQAKLNIWLGVNDAISLEPGADVVLFLSTNPIWPVHCTLEYASYDPEVRPDGSMVYNLEAKFRDSGRLPRIGLKGTAKVYGRHVAMSYYLLRRPLAAIRQWLGV